MGKRDDLYFLKGIVEYDEPLLEKHAIIKSKSVSTLTK